jgi:HNH endonuclease
MSLRLEHDCIRCGRRFTPYRNTKGLYCSRRCSGLAKSSRIIPLNERFWRYVKRGETCWLWTGSKNENGYGVIGRGGRNAGMEKAHRVSWTIHKGPIPDGLYVCHRCDVPACVNPEHLFLGTATENMEDCRRKRRSVHTTPGFAPTLSKEQVDFICDAYAAGFPVGRLSVVFGVSGTSVRRFILKRGRRVA